MPDNPDSPLQSLRRHGRLDVSRCVRCHRSGTVVVFETSGGSGGSLEGVPGSGPLTGRLCACEPHADEIAREDATRRTRRPSGRTP